MVGSTRARARGATPALRPRGDAEGTGRTGRRVRSVFTGRCDDTARAAVRRGRFSLAKMGRTAYWRKTAANYRGPHWAMRTAATWLQGAVGSTRRGPLRRPPRAAGFSVSGVRLEGSSIGAAVPAVAGAVAGSAQRAFPFLRTPGVPRSGVPSVSWHNGCSSRRRAAIARVSSGPSTRWCARSSCTARPSMSDARSSTTPTSSAISRRAAPSSSRARSEVPHGATLVLSAHGVAPAVHERAEARLRRTIDATCPLVTRVHAAVRRYAAAGATRHARRARGARRGRGHAREAPESTFVETADDADASRSPTRSASRTSRRPRCRWTRPPRSSPCSAAASRRSRARTRATSVTRPPTASRR